MTTVRSTESAAAAPAACSRLPNAPRVEGTSAELMESLRRMNVPTRLDQVRRFVVLVVNSVTGPE